MSSRDVALAGVLAIWLVGCGARATPEVAQCTMAFPVSVGVDSLSARAVSVPTADVGDSQMVERWETSSRVIEIRWPAPMRALFADRLPSEKDEMVSGAQVEYANHVHLLVESAGDPVPTADVDVLITDVLAAEKLPEACRMMQVAVSDRDGHRQLLGVRLEADADTGPQVVDLGPLIGRRYGVTRAPRPTEALLCPTARTSVSAAEGAPVMPTAPEALRSFLESPVSSSMLQPFSWRPYDQIVVQGGPGAPMQPAEVRYEHFVFGTKFVSVQVMSSRSGWVVTRWLTGDC